MGRRGVVALVALLIGAAPLPARAGILWEPVPAPPPSIDLEKVEFHRLAADGERLFAGGSRQVAWAFPVAFDLVYRPDGTYEELPASPAIGWSQAWSAAENGVFHKLVLTSSDRSPRTYRVVSWIVAERRWREGSLLTLANEEPGSFVATNGALWVGTTEGNMWVDTGNGFGPAAFGIPKPVGRRVRHAPRVVPAGGLNLVVADGGIGRLSGSSVVVLDARYAGRDVRDVAPTPEGLLVYLLEAGRMLLERAHVDGVETLVNGDAGDARGFVFSHRDEIHLAGSWNEPRPLSAGRLLSPRARDTNPVFGFSVGTADGVPVAFAQTWWTIASGRLYRGRDRTARSLPAIVDGPAPAGSRYRTELLLGNYGPAPLTARLTFRSDSGAAGPRPLDVPLPAYTERRLEDVFAALREAGALPAGASVGSLFAETQPATDDESFAMSARVAIEGTGRGVAVPSLPAGAGLDSNGAFTRGAILPAVVADDATRTNLAAANASDGAGFASANCQGVCGRGPQIEFRAPDGTPKGKLAVVLAAGARTQWNGVTIEGVPAASARLLPPGGANWDAQPNDDLHAYAVLQDATTDDGVLMPAVTPSRDALRDVLFLPVAGSWGGAGGARFRTTVFLAQGADTPVAAGTFGVLFRGTAGGVPVVRSFAKTMAPGASEVVEDVGKFLADASGVPLPAGDLIGSLTLTSADGQPLWGLAASTLVAATRPGTPGRTLTGLDALPRSAWSRSSAVVPGLDAGPGRDTNVAVANPASSGAPIRLLAEIRSASEGDAGRLLATLPALAVPPGGFAQWNHVFASAGLESGTAAFAVVREESGAPFVAYGVVVDAGTSDGTVRGALRGPG